MDDTVNECYSTCISLHMDITATDHYSTWISPQPINVTATEHYSTQISLLMDVTATEYGFYH